MRVTFSTGGTRLYDASALLKYPAFKPIESIDIFNNLKVAYGTVSWLDGEIDIAPETVYKDSCVCNT